MPLSVRTDKLLLIGHTHPDSSFVEVKKEAILRVDEFGEMRQAVAATLQLNPAPDKAKLI